MENYYTISQCPVCGTMVNFSHAETNIIACASCSKILLRQADGILEQQSFFKLLDNQDAIQIGTIGKFKGNGFVVKGRFRVWTDESVYNYWTVIFDDNSLAYLAEGYGMFAIQQKIDLKSTVTSSQLFSLQIDKTHVFDGVENVLLRRSEIEKFEVEGELCMPLVNDRFRMLDFADEGGNFMELLESSNGDFIAYKLSYIFFDELQLKNLNERPAAEMRTNCAQCRNQIIVKAFPFTHCYSCNRCGTRYAYRNTKGFQEVGKDKMNNNSSLIPMYSVGTILGISYEVIGYALKREENAYAAQWKEYTLYNRKQGFAFLSEYEGHWTYVREAGRTPVLTTKNDKPIMYDGEAFHPFNRYRYKVVDTLGEFPYNIFDDSETEVTEYISPPEIWIKEYHPKEGVDWFHGEHISSKEVAQAFNIPAPYKQGIGAIEPKGYVNGGKLLMLSLTFIALMLAVHILFIYTKQDRTLSESAYEFNSDTATTVSFATPKFHLDKWKSNVEIDIHAPLDNSWFELDGSLVNADDGTEYTFEQGVEYYHGYTDGENWAEGSENEKIYLNNIPAGNYFLQLQGLRSTSDAIRPRSFNVTAKYDTVQHKNLIILILLLLTWPLFKYIQNNYNETKRWQGSPFSTYN